MCTRTHLGLGLAAFVLAFCALGSAARAAEVDGCWPCCGAPGDRFTVQGTDFGSRPVVTVGDQPVDVLRVRADTLLCRVPAGTAEGSGTLAVNGAPAPRPFRVTAPGRPLIQALSVQAGPAGQVVYAFGRRLREARVRFVDGQGREMATVALVGGGRAARFRVPPALDPGVHTLRFEDADGRVTDGCAPAFEVVVQGPPSLSAIHPADDVPFRSAAAGQRIRCIGTDLAPAGPCRIHWTDADGVYASAPGCSNGYDEVATSVPTRLRADRRCTVRVELGDGTVTPPVPWTGGPTPEPGAVTVDPPAGPPGTIVAVGCTGLCVPADELRAELASRRGTVAAEVLYRHPGGPGHGAAWLIRVPAALAQGTWQLTLHVRNRVTRPVPWEVTELPFAVTGLWPRRLVDGPRLAYRIEGSGFGSSPGTDDLWVLWTSGERALHGSILHRTDRSLRVLPPPGVADAPPAAGWTVYVVRSRRAVTMTARAGSLGAAPATLLAKGP